MCPHTTICVSSYLHVCPHTTFSSELDKEFAFMCPHTSTIFVLVFLYMCPHTPICVSSYYYVCPHTMCVLILLYMCPHTPAYLASSYCYIFVLQVADATADYEAWSIRIYRC